MKRKPKGGAICIRCGREAEHAYEIPDFSGQGQDPVRGYICEDLKPQGPREIVLSPEMYEAYMALCNRDGES